MPKKRAKPKPKKRRERFVPSIFEHQKARSRASKKAWEGRWERSEAPVGPKGRQYLESRYGADYEEYDVAVTDREYTEDPRKRYPKKKK
jgi:hypothetical protein